MDKQYKYTAFISYRHLEPDKSVADKLQRMLENYTPPKSVAGGRKGKWKIFRDETELPISSDLSGGIREALNNSEFLIVICSKKLKESKWCMEEIDYFKELHNGNNSKIITVLVNGTPEEAFPEQLCHQLVPVTDSDGNVTYMDKLIEPLAANVAADTTEGCLKKLKTEFLRVVAPLLGCGYDDLYKREQKKKIRRWLTVGISLFAVLATFLIYNSTMLYKINNINKELEVKTAEAIESRLETEAANYDLKIKTSNILATQALASYNDGRLIEAARLSYDALDDGIPPNPTAEMILSDVMGVYSNENKMLSSSVELSGYVSYLTFNSEGTKLLAIDSEGNIYFIDLMTSEIEKTYYAFSNLGVTYLYEYDVDVENDVAYVAYNDQLLAISLNSGDMLWRFYQDGFYVTDGTVHAVPDSDLLYFSDYSSYSIFTKDGKLVKDEDYPEGLTNNTFSFVDGGRMYVFFGKTNEFAVIDENNAEIKKLPYEFHENESIITASVKDGVLFTVTEDGVLQNVCATVLTDLSMKWKTVNDSYFFSFTDRSYFFPFDHKMYDDNKEMTERHGVLLILGNNIMSFDRETGERYFFSDLSDEGNILSCEPNKTVMSMRMATTNGYYSSAFIYTKDEMAASSGHSFDKTQDGVVFTDTAYATYNLDSPEIMTYFDYGFNGHTMLSLPYSFPSAIDQHGNILALAETGRVSSDTPYSVKLFDLEKNEAIATVGVEDSVNRIVYSNGYFYALGFSDFCYVIDESGKLIQKANMQELLTAANPNSTYVSTYHTYVSPREKNVFFCTSDAMYLLETVDGRLEASLINANRLDCVTICDRTVSFTVTDYNSNTVNVCYFVAGDSNFTVLPDCVFDANSVNAVINNGSTVAFNHSEGYIGYYDIASKSLKTLRYPQSKIAPVRLAFTPDNKSILLFGSSGIILKLDAESGSVLGEYKGDFSFDKYSSIVMLDESTLLISKSQTTGSGVLIDLSSMEAKAHITNGSYYVEALDSFLFVSTDGYGLYKYQSSEELLNLGKEFLFGE